MMNMYDYFSILKTDNSNMKTVILVNGLPYLVLCGIPMTPGETDEIVVRDCLKSLINNWPDTHFLLLPLPHDVDHPYP